MAIRADRAQVTFGINRDRAARSSQRIEMMHVNEAASSLAIRCFKRKPTHSAVGSPPFDARVSSLGIAFVAIDHDDPRRSLNE